MLIVVFLFFVIRKKEDGWPLGKQRVEIETKEEWDEGEQYQKPKSGGHESINPKINNTNDFFACVFPNLVIFPLII